MKKILKILLISLICFWFFPSLVSAGCTGSRNCGVYEQVCTCGDNRCRWKSIYPECFRNDCNCGFYYKNCYYSGGKCIAHGCGSGCDCGENCKFVKKTSRGSTCKDECRCGAVETHCEGGPRSDKCSTSRTLKRYKKRKWCKKDGDCCLWTNYQRIADCGTDQWRNNYQCSGKWLQRRCVDYGCWSSDCHSVSKWVNYKNCGTGGWTNSYRCYGNWVQRYYHYKGCSGSSCYDYYGWRNYTNCGSDYCGAWSSNYCKGGDVYHKRTCYDKGCSGGSCFNNPYVDEQKVQDCEYGCLNGACIGNQPPYIEPGTLKLDGAPDYCNCPVGTGRINFKWTYKDKEGDDQSHYRLQIATDSGFNNKVVDYTAGQVISSGSTGTSGVTVKLSPSPGKLEIGFDDNYYWRMKVKDKKGNWSNWENGSPVTFDTPSNPYPRPDFTWELKEHEDHEEEMPMEEDVLFTNQTTSYAPPNSYSWTFEDGNPSASNEENPTVIFTSTDPPEKKVTLSVIDSNGYFCPPSVQSVTVTEGELPLPEWKEIPPF